MFHQRLFNWVAVVCLLTLVSVGWAGGPQELKYGESYTAAIPDHLKSPGSREAYFYTPGPVTVFAYEPPCVVTIRDPAAPDPPVAVGSVDEGVRYYETTLPAGFYYISVTADAGVLVGVSSTHKCNGYYHYISTGAAYENSPLASKFYLRATNGCDNLMYLFAPQGSSSGTTCCETICLDPCGETFEITDSNDYHAWAPGDLTGVLNPVTGNPIQVLARDDLGYFVPPYSAEGSDYSFFRTYHGVDEYLNIHSFEEGTQYLIQSLQTIPPTNIESGTLDKGETYTLTGSPIFTSRVLKIRTTKGKASVSVIGGVEAADNTNYMSQVLDPAGNMQGSDFITRSHTGGFIHVIGLQDNTHIEVRDSAGGALQSTHLLNQAQILNANPGAGIWRIRADQDVTVCVGKGQGGTFIPMTQNVSGSTPFPPVIAGVSWQDRFPRTSNSSLIVRWLTDELASTKLNYRIGAGGWQTTEEPGFDTEHSILLDISALTERTTIRLRPEATDQSGATTVDDNGGADYIVTVEKDAPDLEVDLTGVVDHEEYYTLHFTVHNAGAGNANNIRLTCHLYGMQPFSEGVDSSYTYLYTDRIDPTIAIDSIYPDGYAYPTLEVKPFLSENGPIDYRLTAVQTQANDDWGHIEIKNHPAVTHDWDDADVEANYFLADYVILASLGRFFSIHSPTGDSAQAMPREMASFANQRNAALAYIDSGDPYVIQDYIQGRFHGLVHEDWRSGGYLLLVGCSGAMPAFGWHLNCTVGGSFDLAMSDNTYANLDEDGHYTPELCVGRITGGHPDTFRSLFTRALVPQSFDKAISVSGTGDGEGTFADNAQEARTRLDGRYGDSFYYRLENYAAGDRLDVYLDHDDNTDFLYYRNHGSVGGWDSLAWWNVPSLSFGGKFPIVYSNACLTGQIQSNNNLAEEFLARCASVFIGATEVSPRSQNNSLGEKITARHRDGQTIGSAFRNAKRSLAGDIHWYTICYNDMQVKKEILMYNLYGDPMRGGVGTKAVQEKEVVDPPAGPIIIALPMVEVATGLDGLDHPTIPDPNADLLLSINEPIVPIYRWTATFAPGIRVNAITFVSRAGETHFSGLDLPTAWESEKRTPGPGDVPSPGTFPTDAFHWTTIENADGGLDVVLTVHPFFYNAETQDATYYERFQFEMDWTTSNISIQSIDPVYDAIPIGSNQEFVYTLNNQGPEESVDLTIDISNMGTSESVALLSANNLSVPEIATVSGVLTWSPAGQPPTGYLATVRVENADTGDERDVAYAQFRVGRPEVKVEDFFFDNSMLYYVRKNEDIDLGLTSRNTGDAPTSATTHLEIRREGDGLLFQEWVCGLQALPAGNVHTCSETWNTSGLPEGDYEFSGWVEYEEGATPVEKKRFGTLYGMRMGWSSPQDVFNRGDKILMTAGFYNKEGINIGTADHLNAVVLRPNFSTFPLTIEEHGFLPYYSTSFIVTAAEPRGIYGVVSTASRDNGPSTLGGRWFVVDDEGFAMSADPPVCVADGITSVTVTSDVVTEDGLTIPDGSLMTLLNWTGVITSPDVDTVIDGIQVASSGGQFEFVWRSPPQTSLDAFAFGTMGYDRPKSGISVRFKGIDYNENRRVDAQDILLLQSDQGAIEGTFVYEPWKDLNEDGVIDDVDRMEVQDRWSLELGGGVPSITDTVPVGAHGIIVRPQPDSALIPPGGDLVVEIVAEGVDDLGGYEFVSTLTGTACSLASPFQVSQVLAIGGNVQTDLGPETYGDSRRTGAYASGSLPGPTGTLSLGSLVLHGDAMGESTLILSSVLFAKTDGGGIPIMQVFEGTYTVGLPTPTPTETPAATPTLTPTLEPTSTLTPTPTEHAPVPGDTNGDGRIDALDLFYFCHFWNQSAEEADPRCNPVEDDSVDANDLLSLFGDWARQ